MYKYDIIRKLRLDALHLRSDFSIDIITNPLSPFSGNIFGNIDNAFESIWKELEIYFISEHYFGTIKREYDETYTRNDFEINFIFTDYIKAIMKRHCMISALEISKEIASTDQYVSLYQSSKLCKDLGFFALTNRNVKKEEFLTFNLDSNESINKQIKNKLNFKDTKSQYAYRKKKSFKELDKNSSSNTTTLNKEVLNFKNTLRSEGNKFNTKARRFRVNSVLNYTNDNIIRWKDSSSQDVPFYNSDLSYTLINTKVSNFESAVFALSQNQNILNNNVISCLRSHFSIIDLFKTYDLTFEYTNINGNKCKTKYDDIDTLLFNNSMERYYNVDLLYELIYLRRQIVKDNNFYFDSSIYDNTLMKITKIPIPFARILFAECAVRARHNEIFLEKVNESQIVNIYSKKYEKVINKKMQQLKWAELFDRYVDQLAGIYIPLLEKAFICSLYSEVITSKPEIILNYNQKLLELLYNYSHENLSLFTFDTIDDNSFNMYYKANHPIRKGVNFLDLTRIDNSKAILKVKDKVKDFLSNDIYNLDDSEIQFLDKYYRTTFNSKSFNHIYRYDLFDLYNELNRASYNDRQEVSKIRQYYRKNKANINIDFMIDLLQYKEQ